jgi:hypothetical protein
LKNGMDQNSIRWLRVSINHASLVFSRKAKALVDVKWNEGLRKFACNSLFLATRERAKLTSDLEISGDLSSFGKDASRITTCL